MPLNTLRLNQRRLHPNERITFIKPLPGPTSARAEQFLNRLAAICYPVMRAHALAITTLEEFAPNREFMGRNFNGGEVVQLVLRRMPGARSSGVRVEGNRGTLGRGTEFVAEDTDGGWLGERAVQMVLMHELAHCVQMNHSKAFWAVRNEYVEHLKVLWQRGYTGEGMWGRGQALEDGRWDSRGGTGQGEFEDVCGGVYRGRRKRRQKVGYAERKRRRLERIEGRFGKGTGVGEDESAKVMLEGKFVAAKPRVANSKRGRELRAAAALARFEQAKVEKEREEAVDEGSETETESEEEERGEELLDGCGGCVKDAQGHSLYRVRDDADKDKMKSEMDELGDLSIDTNDGQVVADDTPEDAKASIDTSLPPMKSNGKDPALNDQQSELPRTGHTSGRSSVSSLTELENTLTGNVKPEPTTEPCLSSHKAATLGESKSELQQSCSICTLLNPSHSMTCQACGSVLSSAGSLNGSEVGATWQCTTAACRDIGYLNPDDAGRCGLCGTGR